MKKFIFLNLLILFVLISCARERSYVKVEKPTPSKTVVLPETKDGKLPKPYVVNGKRYYPLPDAHGFVQFGKASWYGGKFHGRPTASGEIYDMYKKSAAHRTLPLGTYVRVLNLTNKKTTVIRINDRGPFVKGRVIDLSYGAAKDIDLIGPGVADVKVVALARETGKMKTGSKSKPLLEIGDLKRGEFTIQVGAFEHKTNAARLAERLRVIFAYVTITRFVDENDKVLHRVHVSKSETLEKAGEIEKRLEEMGFRGAFIVRI
ncbi:septal ring lytic transglycosylase RlpA family protein [Thermodesulfobacteriota bacterium]